MHFIRPTWPAPKKVCAFTTTRQKGNSLLQYSSFNLADHVGDNPSHVARNRELLISTLKLPSEPVWLKQVHGVDVITLDSSNSDKNKHVDATITFSSGIVCVVMTADCLPILMCDKKGEAIAAIHAGWRGLAKGILKTTFQALGKKPEDLHVWLGPAIGPNHFEVADDVYNAFVHQEATASSCFKKSNIQGKWQANIYLLAKQQLNQMGIESIYGGNMCTFSDENLFYSYRRDQGRTGRMASLIWLE